MTPAEKAAWDKMNATFSLCSAELLSIHELCDTQQVPRQIDGDHLTASQRVAILVTQRRTDAKAAGHNTTH